MKILVACEESQRVCEAFRNKGHEAYSCDILPTSGNHPEWHIQGDVIPLLEEEWDMIIAFPPCTDLAVSGARWFKEKQADGRQQRSVDFFMKFVNANCDKIAIENPIGIMSSHYRKPDQIIQPWQFGDNQEKSTCLWLKGLKPLVPLITEKPELEFKYWVDKRTGKEKRQSLWYYECFKLNPIERAKQRSKTFSGIAQAMADQWG